jgi:hypothetical protein
MSDAKSHFLERLLDRENIKSDPTHLHTYTSERQQSAQAFTLHVERRDGRKSEGFAWSHYTGYQWTDEGSHEKLTLIFGDRILEIEGHNLNLLVDEIREGQLNGIRELTTGQRKILEQDNPDNQPIVSSVRTFPDFDEIAKQIKGEEDEQHTRNARRAER